MIFLEKTLGKILEDEKLEAWVEVFQQKKGSEHSCSAFHSFLGELKVFLPAAGRF